MRTTVSIIIFIFLWVSLLFLGCADTGSEVTEITITGSGNIVSEVRQLDEFSGVLLSGVGNIFITQGDSQLVRVEADDNVIKDVLTTEANDILNAGLKSGSYNNVTVKIYVTVKSIQSISISGAGSIVAHGLLTNSLSCKIDGAGTMNINGSTQSLACLINGAGNIDTGEMSAKNCAVVLNGAGACSVWVSDRLDATLIGVGTIYYFGNPAVVTTSITGTGQIIKQ